MTWGTLMWEQRGGKFLLELFNMVYFLFTFLSFCAPVCIMLMGWGSEDINVAPRGDMVPYQTPAMPDVIYATSSVSSSYLVNTGADNPWEPPLDEGTYYFQIFWQLFFAQQLLYQGVLMNGWTTLFWTATCGATIQQPYSTPLVVGIVQVFFLLWQVLGSFLLGNMIVGIVINSLGTTTSGAAKELLVRLPNRTGNAHTNFNVLKSSAREKQFLFWFPETREQGNDPQRWRLSFKNERSGLGLNVDLLAGIDQQLLDIVCTACLRCPACDSTKSPLSAKRCAECFSPLNCQSHYEYDGLVGGPLWTKLKEVFHTAGRGCDAALEAYLTEVAGLEDYMLLQLPSALQGEASILRNEICSKRWKQVELDLVDDMKRV